MRSIYKQLSEGETIRVLKIARAAAQSNQLCGSLQVVKLQERPKYQALSYVWGPPKQNDPIILIDNCPFQIRASLFQALSKLTSQASTATLWVDQICINQLNNNEKQRQVQLMSRIYQQADQVICWLGVEEDHSDIAFKLLHILSCGEQMCEAYNDLVSQGYVRSFAELFSPASTLSTAVALLFERSWFERLWVVQEVALATSLVVHCGDCSMEGHQFFKAADMLYSLVSDPPAPCLRAPFRRANKLKQIREQVTAEKSLCLPHLAQTLSSWRCEKDADRLNALLGIVYRKNPTEARFIAQYDLPSTELFTRFAAEHIRSTDSLEILHFAGCGDYKAHVLSSNGEQISLDRYIPADDIATWVPDWRIESRPLPLLTSPGDHMIARFSATISKPDYEHNKVSQTLRVRALKVDTIMICGAPCCPSLCDDLGITEHAVFNHWFETAVESFANNDITATFASTLAMDGNLTDENRIESGISPENVRVHFDHWAARNLVALWQKTSEENGREESTHYAYLAAELCRHRTFFITGTGKLGLGSVHVCPGDSVFLIHGLKVPFVVADSTNGSHALRGECFVSGLMEARENCSDADEYLLLS